MPVTRRSNTRQSKEGVVPARKGERRQAPLPLSQAQAPTLALALALAQLEQSTYKIQSRAT